MTQQELDRAVARATGETLTTIQLRGFFLEDPAGEWQQAVEAGLGPHLIDWDELDDNRYGRSGEGTGALSY